MFYFSLLPDLFFLIWHYRWKRIYDKFLYNFFLFRSDELADLLHLHIEDEGWVGFDAIIAALAVCEVCRDEELDLSARTANALLNNDIKTVRDLVMLSESDLKDLKGFGTKALDEVKEKLTELNI